MVTIWKFPDSLSTVTVSGILFRPPHVFITPKSYSARHCLKQLIPYRPQSMETKGFPLLTCIPCWLIRRKNAIFFWLPKIKCKQFLLLSADTGNWQSWFAPVTPAPSDLVKVTPKHGRLAGFIQRVDLSYSIRNGLWSNHVSFDVSFQQLKSLIKGRWRHQESAKRLRYF